MTNVLSYRRDLEAEVIATHGEVSTINAHWIDAACGWEQHRAICSWVINKKWAKLSANDIALLSKGMADARDKRNQAVMRLKLEPDQATTITALYHDESENDSVAAVRETEGTESDDGARSD